MSKPFTAEDFHAGRQRQLNEIDARRAEPVRLTARDLLDVDTEGIIPARQTRHQKDAAEAALALVSGLRAAITAAPDALGYLDAEQCALLILRTYPPRG